MDEIFGINCGSVNLDASIVDQGGESAVRCTCIWLSVCNPALPICLNVRSN